jgi:hypothetical protein
MFGNSKWFRLKQRGWGIEPATWQAGLYFAAWCVAIALPLCLLVGMQRAPEAVIWLLAIGGLLLWDVRQIRRALLAAQSPPEIQFLDESPQSTLATKGFRMRVRR